MNGLTSRLVLIESVRDCFAIAGKCLPSQQTDNVQIERSRVLNQDTKGDIKKTLKFAHFNEVSVTKDREKRGNGNRFNFAFARKLPLFWKENILHTVFLLPEMLLIKLCSYQKFIVGLLNLIFFNFQMSTKKYLGRPFCFANIKNYLQLNTVHSLFNVKLVVKVRFVQLIKFRPLSNWMTSE